MKTVKASDLARTASRAIEGAMRGVREQFAPATRAGAAPPSAPTRASTS